MSDKSNYLENWYLLQFFINFDPCYVGLFSDNPGEDNSGTEFTATGNYDRITVQSGTFTVADNTATNPTVLQFSESSAIWGTASHVGVYDALTNGNLLYYGALDAPVEIGTAQVFRFGTSSFTITEA